MRIGSFFSVLLVALVALGFFLSDSMHLREDLSYHQKEIETLTAALQKSEQEKQRALNGLQNAEQEKQIALINFQNTSQNLQSCQREFDQTNQLIVQLTGENTFLKEQNHLLTSSTQSMNTDSGPAQHQTSVVQAKAFSLIAFIAVGIGSIATIGLKAMQKKFIPDRCTGKTGNYIYLTNDEIKELVHQRRANKRNTPHSDL